MTGSAGPARLGERLLALKDRSGLSYQELAARCAVSKSALHRYCQGVGAPPEVGTVERFSRACDASTAELIELTLLWTQAIAAWESANGNPTPAPREIRTPAEDTTQPSSIPSRSRTRLALIVTIPAAAAFLAGTGMAALSEDETAPTAARCEQRPGAVNDQRSKRAWDGIFMCRNNPGSPLYERARTGLVVGYLDTERSWFVCWTRGERHPGGNDVWYYTQGDRPAGRFDYQAWGYLPASGLAGGIAPDPNLTRPCP